MPLRDYQQAAVDLSIAQLKKSALPTLIEAATGSGKSHIITAVAQWYIKASGKKVLCLAPSKELTEQNCEKFRDLGMDASIFSASIEKCLRHEVVFGTPLSVKNSLDKFTGFGMVIIDEAHRTDDTKRVIVQHLQDKHPNLRVLGLTATPFRAKDGYIYLYDENNEDSIQNNKPYYHRLIYKITAPSLIEQGYLSPIVTPDTMDGYQTQHLKIGSHGKFVAAEVEQAVTGQGRLTAGIIAEVVEISKDRESVLIFATSRKHNLEILASLPTGQAAYIDGKTPKIERERIIQQFKSGELKYLVNVGVLTTGFDAPSVDVVAILRPSESISLIHQMVGRGLRLCPPHKTDCLFLDYAGNAERLFPDGDFFNPKITVDRTESSGKTINAECRQCHYINKFAPKSIDPTNPMGKKHSESTLDNRGYILDKSGNRLLDEYDNPVAGHHGRRCKRIIEPPPVDGVAQKTKQCDFYFVYRECQDCGAQNDIAARDCGKCGAELIDPNKKLETKFSRLDDCTNVRTEKVLDAEISKHIGKGGVEMLKIRYKTPSRYFTFLYNCSKKYAKPMWSDLCAAAYGKNISSVDDFIEEAADFSGEPVAAKLKTISYRNEKTDGSDFWRVSGHNWELRDGT